MKPIELTEEHKSKLLEMCKVLFPQLTDLEIRDSTEDFCFDFEHICIEYGRENDNLVIIHWFEFCMIYLYTKLIVDKYNYYSISDAMSNGYTMIYDQHPIDYLYDEFKN
jgi:hypothetical protein